MRENTETLTAPELPTDRRNYGPPQKIPFFHRPPVVVAAAVLLIAAIVLGALTLFHSFTHETTDDAFIDAHIVTVAPKISGRVTKVYVNDNQPVRRGDLLIDIDPADARAGWEQKKAAIAVAQAKERNAELAAEQADAHLNTLNAAIESAKASAEAAAADAQKHVGDLRRNQQLITGGAISKQDFEHSAIDTKASQASFESKKRQMEAALAYLKEGRKQAASAHAQVDAAKADVQQAMAAENEARLQVSYTHITAPENGRVTNRSVEAGAYLQVGQQLLAIVPSEIWVTANYKETQLKSMRPGQPATISVDAYPGKPLHGHVDSIQAGSGARFSLLPPENATGNFVKVVQRVPVKIVFDEAPDKTKVLGPGMSAIPDVKVSGGLGTAITLAVCAAIAVFAVITGAALWLARVRRGY